MPLALNQVYVRSNRTLSANMRKKKTYYKRDFITDRTADSYIAYKVESQDMFRGRNKKLYQPWTNCWVKLADCSRGIVWSFDDDDALNKIRIVRKMMNDFLDRAEVANKEYIKRNKVYERERKKDAPSNTKTRRKLTAKYFP